MFVETNFFHKAGEGSGGGGGGGSDPHNLGYYADLTALQTAHPTGTNGDFAILGSTDTIWVWDSGTSAWKDTDTKGQVTSVNGQTGAVTLTIPAAQVNSDWNASSGVAEILNKPTLATVATTGAYSDLTGTPTIPAPIQVSTMPTAAAGELGNIYQFVGTTDANYTNGYFYKCVSDGQDPATYSWTQTDVQPQAGGLPSQTGQSGKFLTTDGTDASWAAISGGLPSQTGQSGKFLTTDGTDASWSDKPLVNTFSDSTSVGILSYENRAYPRNVVIGSNIRYEATALAQGDSVWIGDSVNHPSLTSYWQAPNSVIIGSKAAAQENSVVVGYNARGGTNNYATGSVCIGYQAGTNGGNSQVAVGYNSKAGYESVAIGREASANYSPTYLGAYTIAIGSYASATAAGAIQIGKGTNSTGGTLQIGLSTGGAYGTTNQYVLLDTDGTIPADRLPNAINKYSTMPIAASTNEGWIVQFTGATDSTYTHGYIYECKAQGTDPETYAWEAVTVQAGGGGGGLPSQTGNSGKFLTTDGTNASWGEALKRVGSQSKDLGILASSVIGSGSGGTAIGIGSASESYGGSSVAIGFEAVAGTGTTNTYSCVALGPRCKATGSRGIAIGYNAQATAACAMQIGPGTNSTANTCQLGYYNGSSFTTYQLLDFTTGTIPAARHASLPAADGTYVLKLVIASGVPTLSWVAE